MSESQGVENKPILIDMCQRYTGANRKIAHRPSWKNLSNETDEAESNYNSPCKISTHELY